MEWPKLKNIILLLLVCVNVCLLLLAGLQGSRSARYEEETRQAAIDVLEQNGITFGPERLPADTQLRPLTVTRDRESEAQVAQTLLGSAERQGENEVRQLYVGEGGTAEFSMNGTFSVSLQPGAWVKEHDRSHADASQACLERIGFHGALETEERDEASGQVLLTFHQEWEDVPVFSCRVVLTWEGDELVHLEGSRLSGTSVQASARGEPLSAASILVRFLSGINKGGYVCGRVDGMTAGYLLSGAARPVELTPVWRIDTDSGSYYVDAYTGVLTPDQT